MPLAEKQLSPLRTQWGTPWNHHEIIVNLDGILRSCGVKRAHVRRRMTINAIIGSGWRQNCWHYNAFAMQAGKLYKGFWYAMGSEEDTGGGVMVKTPGQPWRAYTGWKAAVDDWLSKQVASSKFYGTSSQLLRNPEVTDGIWWKAHSRHYSTTTTHDHEQDGNSLGGRIKRELAAATPAELAAAAGIPAGIDDQAEPCQCPKLIIVAAVIAAVVYMIWRFSE